MKYNAILCTNYNKAIGNKATNGLIFNIKQEMAMFKQITTYTPDQSKPNIIVMGRNTWDSLPKKPLPLRMNCIISSNASQIQKDFENHTNVKCFSHIDDFMLFSREKQEEYNNVFVIGGVSLYNHFIQQDLLDKIYQTDIETPNNYGDIYLDISTNSFINTYKLIYQKTYKNIQGVNCLTDSNVFLDYTIKEFERKSI
jgi:dihydrofolate reductase